MNRECTFNRNKRVVDFYVTKSGYMIYYSNMDYKGLHILFGELEASFMCIIVILYIPSETKNSSINPQLLNFLAALDDWQLVKVNVLMLAKYLLII